MDDSVVMVRINGDECEYVCSDNSACSWMELWYRQADRRFFMRDYRNEMHLMKKGDDLEAQVYVKSRRTDKWKAVAFMLDCKQAEVDAFMTRHAEYVPLLAAVKMKAELERG